jgi:hypothetical protein
MEEKDHSKCEWDLEYTSCCRNIWKLFQANDGRYYCMTHFRVVEYVLYTSNYIKSIKAPNQAKTIFLKKTKNDKTAATTRNDFGSPSIQNDYVSAGTMTDPIKKKMTRSADFENNIFGSNPVVSKEVSSGAKNGKKWIEVSPVPASPVNPDFPPINSPDLTPLQTSKTISSDINERPSSGLTSLEDKLTKQKSNEISWIDVRPKFRSGDKESHVPKSSVSTLSLSTPLESSPLLVRRVLTKSGGVDSLKDQLGMSGGTGGSLSPDRTPSSSPGGSPNVGRKECNAKECQEVILKHVYQGYFCSNHEAIICGYRRIIDIGRKDIQELTAREAEQNLRKVPHPLYQKDIDNLRSNIKKEEANFINRMFAIPQKSFYESQQTGDTIYY